MENQTQTMNGIKEGDVVLLWFDDERTYMIEAARGKRASIHCGKPLNVEEWIGQPFGKKIICEHGFGYLLKPTMEDLMMKASRESGIIYPKDAALLIMKAGIHSGSKVMEIGTGSGSRGPFPGRRPHLRRRDPGHPAAVGRS